MATHSPAPWAKNLRIIEDANGEEIARLSYERSGYVQANGHLIAAAPDLLAVAGGCLGYLEALPDEARPDEEWLAPLRAAIAKAKGA